MLKKEKPRLSVLFSVETRQTDLISNSRLYKKYGSILLSRAIMRERLR